MKNIRHIIKKIEENSIAWEMGIEAGDELLEVQGRPVRDVFDYRYLLNDELITVLIRKVDGEEWELEIEKEYEEDLGIEFENEFMDDYRSCSNKCIFCFIDQMPPGMRDTLYFKDDDSRLSFLQGNYVTLTNMSDQDLDRVIRYHMSPINISVHTMDPELRCQMLHNRFAGTIAEKLDKLKEAGLEMNGQIVLCKNINDGENLDDTIGRLCNYYPEMQSVSVVPVGLSKYRDGLYPLEAFDKDDAEKVIAIIEKWQKIMKERYGVHFIHGGDEWYILAEMAIPDADRYDGYPQYENGVGMLRLLHDEVETFLESLEGDRRKRRLSIATGCLACDFLEKYIIMIRKKFPEIDVTVYPIRNDFFGKSITVSGLVTGQDIVKQLKGKDLGETLLIPCNMLRMGENVFLDDLSLTDLEEELSLPLTVVDEDGESFVRCIIGEDDGQCRKRRQKYEQTDCCDSGTT